MRYTSHEMFAREIHAYEMHIHELYLHEKHARDIYAHETHAYEMHVRDMHVVGWETPIGRPNRRISVCYAQYLVLGTIVCSAHGHSLSRVPVSQHLD
jgi:hypothetical protein